MEKRRVYSVTPKYERDIWLVDAKSTNKSEGNFVCYQSMNCLHVNGLLEILNVAYNYMLFFNLKRK